MTHTIRIANPDDAAALKELAAEIPGGLATQPGSHYTLVLDDDGGHLAGAAVLTLENGQGELELLAIAPDHARDDSAARLRGVAEALCEAFACGPLGARRPAA